jgi:hypothetical protein
MVLVALGTAGICAYNSVSGYYLAMNVVGQFSSLMNSTTGGGGGGGGGPTGPFKVSNTTSTMTMWLLFPFNNTGTVGLDMKDLTIQVTMTMPNGTRLTATTNAGSIPFQSSKLLNITMLDTSISNAMALANKSIALTMKIALTTAFPASWSIFALTIAHLEFEIGVPGVSFG